MHQDRPHQWLGASILHGAALFRSRKTGTKPQERLGERRQVAEIPDRLTVVEVMLIGPSSGFSFPHFESSKESGTRWNAKLQFAYYEPWSPWDCANASR